MRCDQCGCYYGYHYFGCSRVYHFYQPLNYQPFPPTKEEIKQALREVLEEKRKKKKSAPADSGKD